MTNLDKSPILVVITPGQPKILTNPGGILPAHKPPDHLIIGVSWIHMREPHARVFSSRGQGSWAWGQSPESQLLTRVQFFQNQHVRARPLLMFKWIVSGPGSLGPQARDSWLDQKQPLRTFHLAWPAATARLEEPLQRVGPQAQNCFQQNYLRASM